MTFSELVGAVVQTATANVSAGSRRNALAALETRYRAALDGRDVLAALGAPSEPLVGSASAARRPGQHLTTRAG